MTANECLVPETKNELYDCCGSAFVENECQVFGVVNAVILAAIVVAIVALHFKSTWWHSNWLITCLLLFQILPAVWRTIFYLYGGFRGASPGEFITYSSSDSGDFVVSLTGFAMYMHQLRTKLANHENPEFDYGKYKLRIIGFFWLMFVIYSVYWGIFYWVSLDKRDMSYVDFATSAYFMALIVVYLVVGCGLIDQI